MTFDPRRDCHACEGTGLRFVLNGPWPDKNDWCHRCHGSGLRIVETRRAAELRHLFGEDHNHQPNAKE